MKNVAWLIAVAFFLLNPGFACGSGDPQFQYGATEMRAAVEGNWTLAITPSSGAPATVTLKIEQAATTPDASAARLGGWRLVRAAHACGSRTLVKSAGACLDVTRMPLTVTFVSGDATLGAGPLSGDFDILSTVFTEGHLDLLVGPYTICMKVRPDGTVFSPSVGTPGPAGTVVVTRG